MRAVMSSEFRANMATMLEKVTNDHMPLTVVRQGGKNVVVVSEEDWAGMEETLYLLANPHNALRLAQAVLDLNAGRAEPHDLIAVGPETGAAAAE